ncbi:hypothetical protein [Hymenobacter sp. B1770]|uniref:hypothetical protein n=1 Tax=Hymenobacter sp. B1770 TaxID=1718788 RepID=UPI003CF878E5
MSASRNWPVAQPTVGPAALISPVANLLSSVPAAESRRPLGRLLDAVLYSSAWLAAAAAVQTAATLHQWPPLGAGGYRLVTLVFAATLLVYNLDAALPFKHREPAGTSARKAWQQRHRLLMLVLAGVAAIVAGFFFLVDGWWRYLPFVAPLVALALLYSWPIWSWRGRARALREVPLLKGFLIATVWTAVTVGLPVLLLQKPATAAAGLFGQRFCLIMVIAIVFDIRDYGRDRRAGTRTFPGVLGVPMAKRLALGFLLVSMVLGLARGAAPLAVLLPGLLSAGVVSAAEESRGDYFYALLTDGLLVVQALAYFMF